MDPLLMFGAWAAALTAILTLARLLYNAIVRGVKAVVRAEISALWVDMQAAEDRFGHIEQRLDRLEAAVNQLRDQVGRLTELLMAHTTEMTRRHESR
ncbi:MAG TPA: hypothetical protein VIG24_04075 [Acidimicrobiia bacterium]